MSPENKKTPAFNILIIAQSGRLSYEAILFLATLRQQSPDFSGQIFVAEPKHNRLWQSDPSIANGPIRDLIEHLGGTIISFENHHFGERYPNGNKIEALKYLPRAEPFVFFDTDTVITDNLCDVPFNFDVPSASLRVENTWPEPNLHGPGYTQIWKSLYDRFDLDFTSSLDPKYQDEDWRRYLYFNAGYFYYRCPADFHDLFVKFAVEIDKNPPPEVMHQSRDPWLDQIALPLVIHALGGRRDALARGYLDGKTSCHYRKLPLLYARESDKVLDIVHRAVEPNKIKKVLKEYKPMKRMIYHNLGARARALFDQNNLPSKEIIIRKKLRSNNLWLT